MLPNGSSRCDFCIEHRAWGMEQGDGYERRVELPSLWQVGIQAQKPYTYRGYHN